EPVDLAFCRFLLMHVDDPTLVLHRMAGAVRPGGWVVAQEPITSAGRVGGKPLTMPDAPHPAVGAELPGLLRPAGLDIRDDLAHAAASMELGQAMLDYGGQGQAEGRLACAFVADVIHDLASKLLGREEEWGTKPDALDEALPFVTAHRDPAFLASLAGEEGPRHLDADFEMVQDTFRRFAEDKVRPAAEHVHRTNAD